MAKPNEQQEASDAGHLLALIPATGVQPHVNPPAEGHMAGRQCVSKVRQQRASPSQV